MVLQRGKPVALGFGALPHADCSAELDGTACGSAAAAGDGSWRIPLGGGAQQVTNGAAPHTLTVNCRGSPSVLTAQDVVFGDVYFTSGQSNMELPVEHTFSYWNVSLNASGYFVEPNIRVTKIPHNLQLQPTHDLGEPLVWTRANWTALKGH
eukprot:COSAG02_NODE_3753_length_6282_cov_25.845221_1_plen_151_part_10